MQEKGCELTTEWTAEITDEDWSTFPPSFTLTVSGPLANMPAETLDNAEVMDYLNQILRESFIEHFLDIQSDALLQGSISPTPR